MIQIKSNSMKNEYISILQRVQVYDMWGEGNNNSTFIKDIKLKIIGLSGFKFEDQILLQKEFDEINELLDKKFQEYGQVQQIYLMDILQEFFPYGYRSNLKLLNKIDIGESIETENNTDKRDEIKKLFRKNKTKSYSIKTICFVLGYDYDKDRRQIQGIVNEFFKNGFLERYKEFTAYYYHFKET
jgi:hypothetical protein